MSTLPTACNPNQPVAVRCSIFNGNSAAVTVRGIRPTAKINGQTNEATSVSSPLPAVGTGQVVSIDPGGTLEFNYSVVPFIPDGGASLAENSTSITYSIGAVVSTSDGSTTIAQPALVRCVPRVISTGLNSNLPTAPVVGQFDFNLNLDAVNSVLVGV